MNSILIDTFLVYREERDSHLYSEHLEAFFCKECKKQFPNREAEFRHYLHYHQKSEFPCPKNGCRYRAAFRKDLWNHIEQIHSDSLHCTFEGCVKIFNSIDELNNHIQDDHLRVNLIHKCSWPGCGMTFEKRQHLLTHSRLHVKYKYFKCKWPQCSYGSTVKANLLTHVRLRHLKVPPSRKQKIEQNVPDELYNRAYEFLQVVSEDEGEESLSTPNQPVTDQSAPMQTDSTNDGSKETTAAINSVDSVDHRLLYSYYCKYKGCEKNYLTKQALIKHVRVFHLKEKNYTCSWPGCTKAFSEKRPLRCHMLIHRKLKPFKCKWPGCMYRTEAKFSLLSHIRKRHLKVPASRREQREKNISNELFDRAHDYVEFLPEADPMNSNDKTNQSKQQQKLTNTKAINNRIGPSLDKKPGSFTSNSSSNPVENPSGGENLDDNFCKQCKRQFCDREEVCKHFMEKHMDASLATPIDTVVAIHQVQPPLTANATSQRTANTTASSSAMGLLFNKRTSNNNVCAPSLSKDFPFPCLFEKCPWTCETEFV